MKHFAPSRTDLSRWFDLRRLRCWGLLFPPLLRPLFTLLLIANVALPAVAQTIVPQGSGAASAVSAAASSGSPGSSAAAAPISPGASAPTASAINLERANADIAKALAKLAERKEVELVPIVAAGISLLALFVSLTSHFFSRRAATSDFKAVETVKSDTAQVIAVLRSLIIKGVVFSQQDKKSRNDPTYERFVDNSTERKALESFMNSPTALAYYAHVAKKSKAAREAGNKGEEWRTFFLQLAELRYTSNPWHAAKAAARLEKMFDQITEEDIAGIANGLDDLPRAIRLVISEREHDVLMNAMFKPADGEIDESNFIEFVKYLRERRKIDDPQLDIFWSAASGDLELLISARERGGNPQLGSGAVIDKYRGFVSEFLQARGS